MEIQSRTENNITVVTVTGRMDALTAPDYQDKLNDLIAKGASTFVVDFEGLDYIGSAGLRGILSTAKALNGKGGEVHFANVKGRSRRCSKRPASTQSSRSTARWLPPWKVSADINMKVTRMTCEARIGNLEDVINFVDGCADRIGLTGIKKNKALIAVEEAFVNVCHYAYPGGTGEVELTCRGKNDAFEFEIADNGIPFNMLSLPDPDTTADIMNVKSADWVSILSVSSLTM
jgi:anti-anti-sigma factor